MAMRKSSVFGYFTSLRYGTVKTRRDMMSIFNEARKELWSEIQGLSDEMLNKRPAEDEWSIQEVIDHLKKSI